MLNRHKDANGRPAVITANYAVANPDFDKIRECGFTQYHYEPLDETLRMDSHCEKIQTIWKQGISGGVWSAQLHGREHVQVEKWMESLRNGDAETVWAFTQRMISTADSIRKNNHYAFMDAFHYESDADISKIERIVSDAVAIFTRLFRCAPETFVAPCCVWRGILEEILQKNGIAAMQGGWYQWIPVDAKNGSLRKRVRHSGEMRNGQLHLVRNCLFEHSLFGEGGAVESCLKQIESAFRWRQPAIISSHRVNYIGRIEEANRARGLRLLDELLGRICQKWPDITFISSSELADRYRQEMLEPYSQGVASWISRHW